MFVSGGTDPENVIVTWLGCYELLFMSIPHKHAYVTLSTYGINIFNIF